VALVASFVGGSVLAEEVRLEAPDEVLAGSNVSVSWQGQAQDRDYITIVPADSAPGSYESYTYVNTGNPVLVRAPNAAGNFEIRYQSDSREGVLGQRPLSVIMPRVSIRAATSVVTGSEVNIEWTGPDNQGDFITIVAADAADGSYENYAYTNRGSPARVRAPTQPGSYEIRYAQGKGYKTIQAIALTVTGAKVTLGAPESVVAGSAVLIDWAGPNNSADFITIVAADAPEKTYKNYTYTSKGSPLTVLAPDVPGDYEIRYADGKDYVTVNSRALRVIAAHAQVEVPVALMAGAALTVKWEGPENPGDYITIVPAGTPEGEWKQYEYVTRGNPLELSTSDEPGEYEVRYASGQSDATLASANITLTPADASLSAAESAIAREHFEVIWEGPGNRADFIAIVPAGAEEGTWTHNVGVHWGNPVKMLAPSDPGDYELRYATGQSYKTLARRTIRIEPGNQPALLAVRHSGGSTDPISKPVVELILDASGSMLKRDRGERRIAIARRALIDLVEMILPDQSRVALRVFGHRKPNECFTDRVAPLGSLDRAALSQSIAGIKAKNLAKTPIGASLAMVPEDLAGIEGPVNVILVTDGEETCQGDPLAEIQSLQEYGINPQVNIVGFAIDDVQLKETFRNWARMGSGRYYDAGDFDQLSEGLADSLKPRFAVLAPDGTAVTLGTVNGAAAELKPGAYTIRLLDGLRSAEMEIRLGAGDDQIIEL
jgi:hypothetical protein